MISATAETAPPPGDADDPAIWVHPADPTKSLIIGSDKDARSDTVVARRSS